MSNNAWHRRRLRQRLIIALRRLKADPNATVRIPGGFVAISTQRWEELNAGLTLVPDTTKSAIRI